MSISLKDTANITTANWGTARNIQIGNTAKSVNGSGNVSWSLAEIGAAPSSSTSLNTTDKTIVGAINEVFQSGNSVKQNLVDTLIAKGAEDISTSNSWDSLIDMIEGSNINLAPISFNVEQLPNAQYGFHLLGSGYYESENFGIHNSYAMCKLNIVCNRNYNVYLDCINNAENNYDYGIISQINTPLSFSYQTDPNGVLKSFKGLSSTGVQTVQLKSESGFYYIKYVKDSTASQGNDSLRFKVRFEKKPDGNPDVPGNPDGEETILFSSTIGGDNRSLTGGYTHKQQNPSSYFMVGSSAMDLYAYSKASGGSTLETVISNNKINLTNYSTLRIRGYFTTSSNDSGGAPRVGFDAIGNRDEAFAASTTITSSAQRYYDLDISGLTGNYNLKINVATSLDNRPGEITKHLYITELILYP